MNFKAIAKEDMLQEFVGKEVSLFDVTKVEGVVKMIRIKAGDAFVQINVGPYNVDISKPAQEFVITGQFRLGSCYAELTPEKFDTEAKASKRLIELIDENETFEGIITPVTEV